MESSARNQRPLWSILRPYLAQLKLSISVLLIVQIASTVLSLALPALNARLVDNGIAKADIGVIEHVGVIMLAMASASMALSIAATVIGSRLSTTIARGLRRQVYRRVSSYSAADLRQFGIGSLITRTTNDVSQVQQVAFITTTVFVTAPILTIGGVVLALRVSIAPAPVIVLTAVMLVVVVVVIMRRMIPQFALLQRCIDSINRVIREQLSGVRIVRAFGRERTETERFDEPNALVRATAYRVGVLQTLLMAGVMIAANAGGLAVLAIGGPLTQNGTMQVGQVIAYVSYLGQILSGITVATLLITILPRARISATRINEVLDTVATVAVSDHPVTPQTTTGQIELSHISVCYPGAPAAVLSDVSLQLQPGTITGLIGGTGSGKTTLINLIPRLLDPSEGTVLVNKVDVREQRPEILWSQMALVSQQPSLISGTVASNLRIGSPHATDEQLWEALEIACAADFVSGHDDGLHQAIRQSGANLSGGQQQRLALARAVLRRPRIFLLDDPFSALDPETERRVKENLAPIWTDATVLIASQRLSSISGADRIAVINDGVLAGWGAAAALAETCRPYQELVASQSQLA